MSAPTQAAAAGDALGALLGEAAVLDGVTIGDADEIGLGLGVGLLPQAPTRSAPSTASSATREGRRGLGYAIVGLVKRLRCLCGRTILPELAE
jgi:hypothetical protein